MANTTKHELSVCLFISSLFSAFCLPSRLPRDRAVASKDDYSRLRGDGSSEPVFFVFCFKEPSVHVHLTLLRVMVIFLEQLNIRIKAPYREAFA